MQLPESFRNGPDKRRLSMHMPVSRSLTPGYDTHAARRPSMLMTIREESRLKLVDNEARPSDKDDQAQAKVVRIKENKVAPIDGNRDSITSSSMEVGMILL